MKRVAIITSFVLLIGCVSQTARKPSHTQTPSIVDTVAQYFKASQKGLVSPGRLIYGNPFAEDSGAGYRKFNYQWCLDNRSSKQELQALAESHCQAQGGYLYKKWCVQAESDLPIYLFTIVQPTRRACAAGEEIRVSVAEAFPGSDRQWRLFARNELGYKTPFEDELEQDAHMNKKIMTDIANRARRVVEAQHMLNNPGTRICKDVYLNDRPRSRHRYNAIVLGALKGMINIHIFSAQVLGSNGNPLPGLEPGGFRPSETWDDPTNWSVCGREP